MSVPRVSVMVCLYNSAAYLEGCVESLRRQTLHDFEVLLADGGSSDATPEMARKIAAADARFRFLPAERFKLISECRKEALGACRSEYVAVLDSDDEALPGRLQAQVAWLDANPQAVLLTTYYRVVNRRGWPLRLSGIPFKSDIDLRWRLTFGNCLTQSTLMYRREAALRVGGYDPSIRAAEDMEFYSRLMGAGRLDVLPRVLNVWRWHPKSLSKTEPVEYKTDFVPIVQRAIERQLALKVPPAVAAAVYNQSRAPAVDAPTFRQALELTEAAVRHLQEKLYDPAHERRRLARAAFLQLVDLFTRNVRQPWWSSASDAWARTVRRVASGSAHYRWYADAGLLGYYKKLLKSDWRFVASLGRTA